MLAAYFGRWRGWGSVAGEAAPSFSCASRGNAQRQCGCSTLYAATVHSVRVQCIVYEYSVCCVAPCMLQRTTVHRTRGVRPAPQMEHRGGGGSFASSSGPCRITAFKTTSSPTSSPNATGKRARQFRARQFLSPQTSRGLPGLPGGGDSDDETDGHFVPDSDEFKLYAAAVNAAEAVHAGRRGV
jgi:hypothetical protein